MIWREDAAPVDESLDPTPIPQPRRACKEAATQASSSESQVHMGVQTEQHTFQAQMWNALSDSRILRMARTRFQNPAAQTTEFHSTDDSNLDDSCSLMRSSWAIEDYSPDGDSALTQRPDIAPWQDETGRTPLRRYGSEFSFCPTCGTALTLFQGAMPSDVPADQRTYVCGQCQPWALSVDLADQTPAYSSDLEAPSSRGASPAQ